MIVYCKACTWTRLGQRCVKPLFSRKAASQHMVAIFYPFNFQPIL